MAKKKTIKQKRSKKPAKPIRRRVAARKASAPSKRPKKTSKPAKRAVRRRLMKRAAPGKKAKPVKRIKTSTKRTKVPIRVKAKPGDRRRAAIVRRRNKAGHIYYFNKKTKRFSKKSSWYKYRVYAIKQKPKKAVPVKVKKEREKLTIDLESALIKIDLDKASDYELREEVNRLILEQMRWRDRLDKLKLKKNRNKVKRQLTRYARAIHKIKTILGEYQKPKGFEEKEYQIGKDISVDNIYRWEVKKFLDEVLESEMFEVYIVQGVSFPAETEIDIHLAVDDLIIDAEMNDIYYLRFTRNAKTKVVHITLNQ